jgi:bidirectional [NiFe] hydrogenase diaphorase subunit
LEKGDKRRLMLEKVLKEHNYQESALLEILHRAQEIYGYLDRDLLTDIAGSLNLPPSHVYGVTTFYSFFKLRKPGEIMEAIEEEFNLKRGASTTDGKLSLLVTRCIGACAMAPNIVVDDEVIGKATKETVIQKIKEVLAEEKKVEAV